MARIVDIEQFFAILPTPSLGNFPALYFHIEDDFAPWNTGVWKLDHTGGKLTVEVGAESDRTKAIPITIQSFTALAVGHSSAMELAYLGRLAASSEQIAWIDAVFPKTITYGTDFF